jgi:hypothetical protein
MKHLVYMRTNACRWLDLAVNSKKENAGLLRYAKFALLDCYEEFDGIIENFKDYPPASRAKIIAPVLREFYGAPPKDLGEMVLVRRRKHALDECPYCGHPLAPRTLDHFLPKEDWPEYAIFSNNLVPQCSDCAPIKGQRYYCTKIIKLFSCIQCTALPCQRCVFILTSKSKRRRLSLSQNLAF